MQEDAEPKIEVPVRHGVRVKSPAVVSVRKTGQSKVATKLLDLSVSGFRIDLDGLPVGMIVWLKLPQIESQMARVVWSTTRETGCRFDVPLHAAVVCTALRAIGADPQAIAELDRAIAGVVEENPKVAAAQRGANRAPTEQAMWNAEARTISFTGR